MYKNRCDDWSWVADTRATSLSEVEVVINGRKLPEWSLYEVMDSLCVVMWHYLEQEWALFRKRQTLLLLRKLESFNVCNWLLKRFLPEWKISPTCSSVVCWGDGIKCSEANRLIKLISKDVRQDLDRERRMVVDRGHPSFLLCDGLWHVALSAKHR